jgi:hypothetical protein
MDQRGQDHLVEVYLRTLQSFMVDPGPPRSSGELRAFLRLWLAPAIRVLGPDQQPGSPGTVRHARQPGRDCRLFRLHLRGHAATRLVCRPLGPDWHARHTERSRKVRNARLRLEAANRPGPASGSSGQGQRRTSALVSRYSHLFLS